MGNVHFFNVNNNNLRISLLLLRRRFLFLSIGCFGCLEKLFFDCLEVAERLLQRASRVCPLIAAIAYLHKLLLQTRFAHELVDKRADLRRFLAVAGEGRNVRVCGVVDDECFERARFPLEKSDRTFAAEKLAREPALAHALGGGNARCGVHIHRRFFPALYRAIPGAICAQNVGDGGGECLRVAERRIECQRERFFCSVVQLKFSSVCRSFDRVCAMHRVITLTKIAL